MDILATIARVQRHTCQELKMRLLLPTTDSLWKVKWQWMTAAMVCTVLLNSAQIQRLLYASKIRFSSMLMPKTTGTGEQEQPICIILTEYVVLERKGFRNFIRDACSCFSSWESKKQFILYKTSTINISSSGCP